MTYEDQFDAIRKEARANLEAQLMSDEALRAFDRVFASTVFDSDDMPALPDYRRGMEASLASHPTPDGPASLPRHVMNTPSARAAGDDPGSAENDQPDTPAPPVLGDEERERLWTIADQIEAAVKERKIPDEANRDARYLRNLSGLGDQLRAGVAQGEER